ncbi:MAG: thermonuclease family protein [Alphaproteobacteria bacterium]|nr:thermonuclease family protein [Alphaproteobacteria bacterium]
MAELITICLIFLGFAYYAYVQGKNQPQIDDLNYYEDPDYAVPVKKEALSESEIREKIPNLTCVKVVRVLDGDTVIVSKASRKQFRIRLDSIDCPEDGQPWGDIAKFGLIKLIGGQNVRLEVHGKDGHGRDLATIYVWHRDKEEWLNVNERMIILGHAWVMRAYYDHLPNDRKQKLNRLEKWAKSKKIGLWKHPNPIPPWQWRHGE